MVDIHQPGDYPILLGDSLKDDASSSASHISLRYNWIPKSGLAGNTGRIKVTSEGISLAYDRNGEALEYKGWLSERSDANQNPQLALFYDASKSAFVVEKLAATLDLNLHSGTNITPDHITRHSQIPNPGISADHNVEATPRDDDENESPDDSNPFDYRHFLNEAKENAEKASLAGNRTPLPGGHTPMSGLSSPMGASHFLQATTPQFGPVEVINDTHLEDAPQWGDRRYHQKSAFKKTRKPKATTSRPNVKVSSAIRKSIAQSKPLSSERVQDSDSESDSDVEPARPTSPKAFKKTPPKKKSQAPQKSPAIVIHHSSDSSNSDDGGLEVESGSPPPSSTRKRAYKIDTDAFRSQTNTPALTRPTSSHSNVEANDDIDMPDADVDVDIDANTQDIEDEYNKFLASDSDSSSGTTTNHNKPRKPTNIDVDELILDDGSTSSPEPVSAPIPSKPARSLSKPAALPAPIHAPTAQRAAKRRQSSTISRASRASRARQSHGEIVVGSPDRMVEDEDDEDDGGLAAELEAALAAEEDGDGVGLGIVGGGEEESDVSEEE